MIDYFKRHLAVKLFLSYMLVLLAGVAVIALASRAALPGAFNQHMNAFPSPGGGQGMMSGPGLGNGMMPDLFRNFQASFNQALWLALLAAGVVAVVVSLLLSRGVVAPVQSLTSASQRIADGHYTERVQGGGQDELGQLAHSFNQMAEKLEQVEAMRRQLIGDVSHELRTPLTAIQGSMEGLMDGVLPATPETFQQIHAEAGRLSRLVDDLQELSRVEAGAYQLDIRPFDPASLVHTALKRFTDLAQKQAVNLQDDMPAGLPQALGDEARMAQVLTNLVGNALQYTPQGGEVFISATQKGGEIEFTVRDTGIGIPPEHLPHLFTRFYRVDKSRSRQAGGGSGIGLTIAKHLVEAQGGRIWAESDGEGRGSTFHFTLKAA
jgi:two-component system sensor histidine kinase BaeS